MQIKPTLPPGRPQSNTDEHLQELMNGWIDRPDGTTVCPSKDIDELLKAYKRQEAWSMALEKSVDWQEQNVPN